MVSVFAFGIYLRTLLPGVGFWDTGEAQTVPHTLSIFHPTGFPTYAMLGWLWSQLPLGEVAWRMNLLSAVCVALAAGLVTLISGHLIEERNGRVVAIAAGIAGAAFAFAAEPWENAVRADVHALNVFFVALIMWLLFTWRAAERSGTPHAGRWLAAAALAFGLGMGNHPLVGLMAFAIAPWLFIVDPGIWRRWRLVAVSVGMLVLGLATYAYIPIRAIVDPEPPLFYARPDTLERLRYLVFAEQFRDLFQNFEDPFAFLARKWQKSEEVLALQLFGPGWLLAAFGAATLAVRRFGAFIFVTLVVAANLLYSMNFKDGDIDRYYMPAVVAAAPLLGVAIGSLATICARAVADAGRRLTDLSGRRRLARVAATLVLLLGVIMPAGSLVTNYTRNDRSADFDAERWTTSVYRALPPDSVVVSWWSYSTPLWYSRYVEDVRPDVRIIDERDIIDEGWGTIDRAIRRFMGERPVFVVPPHWEYAHIVKHYEFQVVATYPGFTDLLRITGVK